MDLIDLNLKSPEQFWIEWASGELDDLPYRTCSLKQAYRAYLKWCQRTGERFPLKRNVFTRQVVRIGEARAGPMNITAPSEWISAVTDDTGRRKTTRMLLVTAKPEGLASESAWATECVSKFEPELREYLGISRSHGPDEPTGGDEGSS